METVFGEIGSKENTTATEFIVGKMAKPYQQFGSTTKLTVRWLNISTEELLKDISHLKHKDEVLAVILGRMEITLKENGLEEEMELGFSLQKTEKHTSNPGKKV